MTVRAVLPPRPYLPGRTPRPPEDFFDAQKAGGQAFDAGRDAFRRRYYWEAHELMEPVWLSLPPGSAEKRLVQGLIQLANAGLKARLGREKAVARILELAEEALADAFRDRDSVLSVTRRDLDEWWNQVAGEKGDSE